VQFHGAKIQKYSRTTESSRTLVSTCRLDRHLVLKV
jgi:hypothetical protein